MDRKIIEKIFLKDKIVFLIDNVKVKEINQSPDYPIQFMLGIYEIPDKMIHKTERKYPKEFIVDYVKGSSEVL